MTPLRRFRLRAVVVEALSSFWPQPPAALAKLAELQSSVRAQGERGSSLWDQERFTGKSQPSSAPGERWSVRNWGEKGSLGCGGFRSEAEGSHSGLPVTLWLGESCSLHKCVTCLFSQGPNLGTMPLWTLRKMIPTEKSSWF